MANIVNLGIVAHVDAGKTSLTERLLYAAGVIEELGSVDNGNTATDFLELERARGITIKSAVASFPYGDETINLVDTPGHPDFIAEVERVLGVLDGAVLVISAVEGVQAQSRVLLRTLRRLRIPTIIFVNKIDRPGADCARTVRGISRRLAPTTIPMGSVIEQGTRDARFVMQHIDDTDFSAHIIDVLSAQDDALLADYIDSPESISRRRLYGELTAQVRRATVHPVFYASAMTGTGVDSLMSGVTELLSVAVGDTSGPVSGMVFKVERGASGERNLLHPDVLRNSACARSPACGTGKGDRDQCV